MARRRDAGPTWWVYFQRKHSGIMQLDMAYESNAGIRLNFQIHILLHNYTHTHKLAKVCSGLRKLKLNIPSVPHGLVYD